MRFFYIFALLVFLSPCLYSEISIVDYNGDVKFRKNTFSEWESVNEKNMVIPDGGAVKTDTNSKAKLLVNKSTVWLKENTALEIESTSEYFTSLGLVYGKIKASSFGLAKNSRFQIRTITAVFGIRGTDIMIVGDINGKVLIDVLFGEVDFEYAIPPKTGKRSFIITQGMYFSIEDLEKPYKMGLISKEYENEILSNWDPSISSDDLSKNLYEMDNRMRRLRSFVLYSKALNNDLKKFIYKEREIDFEAGRTLKDIHGNTVRVDQRLLRPDEKSLELFNIVKRKNYSDYSYSSSYSSGLPGFKYNGGGVTNRLDSFIITFNFNKPLPDNVNKWSSYFNDDFVRPEWITFVSADITSANNLFFAAKAYKYNEQRDKLVNNTEVVGVTQNTPEMDNEVVLTGIIDKSSLSDITGFKFIADNISSPDGSLVLKDLNGNPTSSQIGSSIWGLKTSASSDSYCDNRFCQMKSDQYKIGDNNSSGYFWLSEEDYLISNSGSIREKDALLDSNKNIGELVKDNSFESVIYVKKDSGGFISDDDYFAGHHNIDIIIIPDIPFYLFDKTLDAYNRWKN